MARDVTRPVIGGLHERTRRTLRAELDRSLRRRLKHLSEADREALGCMLDGAARKLLQEASGRLEQLATRPGGKCHVAVVCELFGLSESAL